MGLPGTNTLVYLRTRKLQIKKVFNIDPRKKMLEKQKDQSRHYYTIKTIDTIEARATIATTPTIDTLYALGTRDTLKTKGTMDIIETIETKDIIEAIGIADTTELMRTIEAISTTDSMGAILYRLSL
jgi:hypothetical protein